MHLLVWFTDVNELCQGKKKLFVFMLDVGITAAAIKILLEMSLQNHTLTDNEIPANVSSINLA